MSITKQNISIFSSFGLIF